MDTVRWDHGHGFRQHYENCQLRNESVQIKVGYSFQVWEIRNKYSFFSLCLLLLASLPSSQIPHKSILLSSHQPRDSWRGNLGSKEGAGFKVENYSHSGLLPNVSKWEGRVSSIPQTQEIQCVETLPLGPAQGAGYIIKLDQGTKQK